MCKISFYSLAALIFSATPLHASPIAEKIADQAKQCWVLPEPRDYQKATAVFEVTYDADGHLTDVITVEYQPVRKAGEIFALSAQQALFDCANTSDIRSRTIRVVMSYVTPREPGALIMKRSLR